MSHRARAGARARPSGDRAGRGARARTSRQGRRGPARTAALGRPRGRAGGADVIAVLRRHPYFAALPLSTLAAVARRARVATAARGAVLFEQGERTPGLYVVATGAVRIFKASPEGREQVLHHVGPGQSFNDVAAFDGGPCPATAQALQPTTVVIVSRPDLLALMHRHPALAVGVVRLLSARLRELSSLVEDLSLRQVIARVAAVLARLGAEARVVTLPTRQELAAMVGTVREVVTRALGHLARAGAIRLGPRGRVTIVDPAALARLAALTPPSSLSPAARPGAP